MNRPGDYSKVRFTVLDHGYLFPSRVNRLSNKHKAYIAGFIDGEGCIGIYKTGGGKRCDAAGLSLRLNVGSTNFRVLKWMMRKTGVGSIYRALKKVGLKQSWQWQVRSREAVELLFELTPYIIVKEPQLILACEFANTIGLPGRHKLNKVTRLKREEIREQMSLCNKRGD